MDDYIANLNQEELFPDLLEFARQNKVPIINRDSLNLIKTYLYLFSSPKILEIGTAIGYSALHFALANPTAQIDTLERDAKMIEIAQSNFQKYDGNHQINLIPVDALEWDGWEKDRYQIIFIDGAKAQYQKFFAKYQEALEPGGLIITDNIGFHNLVGNDEKEKPKRIKNLVTKVENYNQWLKDHPQFVTTFFLLGDGLAVSWKVR